MSDSTNHAATTLVVTARRFVEPVLCTALLSRRRKR